MSALRDSLRAFAAADPSAWRGLPDGLELGDVAAVLGLDRELGGEGIVGAERRPAAWVSGESEVYEGGLRVWHEAGRVLVLEGRDPIDAGGNPLSAPELGEPEAVLDSVLARVRLPGGERVYAQRGLALRVNPENRLLLAVLGFAPTDAADYAARIRPELSKQRLLAGATGR